MSSHDSCECNHSNESHARRHVPARTLDRSRTLPIKVRNSRNNYIAQQHVHETRCEFSSHGTSTRSNPYSMKGRLCPSISSEGVCPYMADCPYSHTIEEARSHNLNFKTKICEFAANGYCAKANECRYAHSFSELVPEDATPDCRLPDQFALVDRNVSAASTIDVTHSLSGSDWELSPIAERPRVCYVAPAAQRTVVQKKQRRIMVPSSFHYVEQLEQRMQQLLPAPLLPTYDNYEGFFHYPCVYGTPMVYNMGVPNVLYED